MRGAELGPRRSAAQRQRCRAQHRGGSARRGHACPLSAASHQVLVPTSTARAEEGLQKSAAGSLLGGAHRGDLDCRRCRSGPLRSTDSCRGHRAYDVCGARLRRDPLRQLPRGRLRGCGHEPAQQGPGAPHPLHRASCGAVQAAAGHRQDPGVADLGDYRVLHSERIGRTQRGAQLRLQQRSAPPQPACLRLLRRPRGGAPGACPWPHRAACRLSSQVQLQGERGARDSGQPDQAPNFARPAARHTGLGEAPSAKGARLGGRRLQLHRRGAAEQAEAQGRGRGVPQDATPQALRAEGYVRGQSRVPAGSRQHDQGRLRGFRTEHGHEGL
mmetsp:Transcript_7803/g.23484  ORF Transcript_7803/g.23484 Transcript_7803/m.23484 type:complete len:329 (+) Transcript_7803:316-1302(+)